MSEREAGRLIVRGAYATALGFAMRFGARLLFLFVATRLYGATAFGTYVLAVAVVELATSAGNLGTKKLIFQFFERPGGRPLAHVLLDCAALVALVSGLFALLIAGAAMVVPSTELAPATALAFALIAPMVIGQSLLDLFLAATRWNQAVRYEVIGRSIVEPYAGVIAVIAAWLLGATTLGLVAGYWAGTLVALGFAVFGAWRTLGGFRLAAYRPDTGVMRRLGQSATANSATDLLTAFFGRVDLYLVGALLGEAAAGIYGVARQIAVSLRQIRQSFDGLLIPLVARTLAARGSQETGRALASATRLVLAIQMPLIISLVAAGAPILEWFGPGFSAAYWALIVLALAEAIQAAFSIGDLMFVYLKPRIGLYQTLIGIVVGVATAFPLIAGLGITGAAISVLVAHAVRVAMREVTLRRQFGVAVGPSHHGGPLLAGAVGCAVVALIPDTVPAGLTGLAVYAGVLTAWVVIAKQPIGLRGFHLQRDPPA